MRGVAKQVAKIRLVRRIAELADRLRTADEPIEAQHVHDADTGKRGGEEIGSLVDDRADEKATVGLALNREAVA